VLGALKERVPENRTPIESVRLSSTAKSFWQEGMNMGVEVLTKEELDDSLQGMRDELKSLRQAQEKILAQLERLKGSSVSADFIPALDFMNAVGIKRWKFDQLVAANMIKTIKKKRKVYVAVREVQRYFLDPTIQ
jgi:predicted transcriptional regulator